ITDLEFNGKPIDLAQKFVVATNNYRAGGGGNFPGLDGSTIIVEAPDENRTVLGNYILTLKNINPSADDNWSFKPINDQVNVTFTTSPKAENLKGVTLPITKVGTTDEGFTRYKLKF
ncbi:MAG: 5'-nucleotidase C-terminal domain-containing protein, partial [Sneathiella sp.]